MKLIVAVLLLGVIFSMGRAMFHMVQPADKRAAGGMSKALATRVALSVLLFAVLGVSSKLGLA
ncbi:MAG: DUF2909 domain-containing protein [Gammaproteobacteria bacterium]